MIAIANVGKRAAANISRIYCASRIEVTLEVSPQVQ